MQGDELNLTLKNKISNQMELDSALHELGMLATCTKSRKEYLNELYQQNVNNLLKMNTRFVSNVSVGFQVRPIMQKMRYKPYEITRREVRLRTKSETKENEETTTDNSAVQKVVEETFIKSFQLVQLKKAKSLENIAAESVPDFIPEVEVVSDCIEKLKVAE